MSQTESTTTASSMTTTTTTTTLVPAVAGSGSTTTSTTNKPTLEEAMKTVEIVKEQINQYDIQSSKYKTSLRNITAAVTTTTTTTKNDNNSVTIEWVKVDAGTIVEPPKKLLLQLSSPIEEAVLYLPPYSTNTNTNSMTFHGVETGQATLSITVEWDTTTTTTTTTTIEKSETTYMDVSKFTHELLNVLQSSSSSSPKLESHETTLRIPILPIATTNEDNVATTTTTSDVNTEALCTVTMNVKYVPSYKDIREELCDCIGKIATQKAIAREELRKASLIVHELSSASNTSTKNNNPKPSTAVKSGFLQKDKSTTTNSDGTTTTGTSSGDGKQRWYTTTMEWYNRTMTNTMIIVPVIKNYIFFIAFTVVTHYYGHQLAIPPPV